MYYSQATIDNLLGEHVAIRGHLDLVMCLTREWKELLNSQKSILKSRTRLKSVVEKRNALKQAMGYLVDGLKGHHIHEDEVMPSLIGELLMKAIRIEHDEMLQMFNDIDSVVVNTSIEDFLEKGAEAMQRIDDICNLASTHSSKEDGILLLLKKVPELRG